jgi:hypothetical protein
MYLFITIEGFAQQSRESPDALSRKTGKGSSTPFGRVRLPFRAPAPGLNVTPRDELAGSRPLSNSGSLLSGYHRTKANQ